MGVGDVERAVAGIDLGIRDVPFVDGSVAGRTGVENLVRILSSVLKTAEIRQ